MCVWKSVSVYTLQISLISTYVICNTEAPILNLFQDY